MSSLKITVKLSHVLLLSVSWILNGANVQNYYIKSWATISGQLPSNDSSDWLAGYDQSSSESTIKIIGGLWGMDRQTAIYEFNINSQIFSKSSSTLDGSGAIAQGANGYVSLSHNIYFSNHYWSGENTNFYAYNMVDNSMVEVGYTYHKPFDTTGECFTTNGIQYIYLIGDMNYGNKLQIFDVSTNVWSIGPELNVARDSPACIYSQIDSALYVFGGDQAGTHSIEKYVVSSDHWQLLDINLMDWYNPYPVAYMVPYSNTIFIVDLCRGCNTYFIDTQTVEMCVLKPTCSVRLAAAVYVDTLKRFYTFGGSRKNMIQYTITCPHTAIDLELSSKTLHFGEVENVPIMLPAFDSCTPDKYNFSLTNIEYNISEFVSSEMGECSVCQSNICTDCSIGLNFSLHHTLQIVYENNNLYKLVIKPVEKSHHIELSNSIELKLQSFLDVSGSNTTLTPGKTVPISIQNYQLKQNELYQFRLYSTTDAITVDNILNIQTNDTEIESCTIGSDGVYLPCLQGVAPNINYNFIDAEHKIFHISLIAISTSAENVSIFPSNGIRLSIRTCDPGYGIDNLNQAQCLLCPYNSFTLKPDIKPCHICRGVNNVICAGGNDVIVRYNHWLSALNKTANLFYPFIDITQEDGMISTFCPPGYCCSKNNGCNYLVEHDKNASSLCAFGRNMSTPLCGKCNKGLSELIGSTKCGECRNTKYWLLTMICVFIVSPFVIYVAYFDSAPKQQHANNDPSNKAIEIFKTLIFDVGIYYYQALSIIFSSKGITVSSWFESIALSLFSLQFGGNSGNSNGFCVIGNLDSYSKLLVSIVLFPIFTIPMLLVITTINCFTKLSLKHILCCYCQCDCARYFDRKPYVFKCIIRLLLMYVGTVLSTLFQIITFTSLGNGEIVYYYAPSYTFDLYTTILCIIFIVLMLLVFGIIFYILFKQSGNNHEHVKCGKIYNKLMKYDRKSPGNPFIKLITSFKDNKWYWQFVILFRRVMISALSAYQFKSPNTFNLILSAFIVIYFGFHIRIFPFNYQVANSVEALCLLSLILILNCLYFAVENEWFFDTFITFCILFPLVVFSWYAFKASYLWWKADDNCCKECCRYSKRSSHKANHPLIIIKQEPQNNSDASLISNRSSFHIESPK